MSRAKRVVIIGAGPGGLASAMLLAAAGYQVTVLERQSRVGGRTSTLVENGFRFDLGPTFFLYPRVLESIFAAVGRDLHAEVPMVRLDPQYHLVFGAGGELRATPDLSRMEAAIAALSPRDAGQLPAFPGRQSGQDERVSRASWNRPSRAGATCFRRTCSRCSRCCGPGFPSTVNFVAISTMSGSGWR